MKEKNKWNIYPILSLLHSLAYFFKIKILENVKMAVYLNSELQKMKRLFWKGAN